MNKTSKCLCLSIGKFLLLFLYLVFRLEETGAEHHITDSSITSSKQDLKEEESDNGRIRRQTEPTSDFEHIYKTLYERGLFKMCSILRNSDQQELNQTLGKNKEFTILAATDEAFNLIPGSQFEEIKNDKQKRQEFIRQHIIPSTLQLSKFRAFDEREFLNANGLKLHITAYPNGFVINGANAVEGDIRIPKTRGLIQVVDKVLYPQKQINLLQVLEENPHLTQISSFLALSGLQNELTTNDTFTFFAPNDEAFRAVPWPVTQQMLSNNTFLRLLIANHVIPGKHYSSGLGGTQLSSIGGNMLNFTSRTVQSHSLVLVNLVPIIDSDLIATNGVIQIITRIMLPKELMDDCNCLQNETTTKPNELSPNNTLFNETMATLDPLIKEMLASDPRFNNNIDRRIGSAPINKARNGDHFTSTPKPVTFKTFWDDIFGTTEDNANKTDITANTTLTTASDGITTNLSISSSTTTSQNTTDFPFIWDYLTTEISNILNETSDRFTSKPTLSPNNILLPQSMSQLRQFTPGVEYIDETNGTSTITTVNATVSENASTALPSMWTRPFYRPERRRPETTSQNNTGVTDTPLTIGSSFFRPTLRPMLRPTLKPVDESNPQSNTVPPYDRRSGLHRERTPDNELESRSRMVRPKQPVSDNQYVEQQIESQFDTNQTQYQRDYNYSDHQYYQRPPYQPQNQPQSYQPFDAQPLSPQNNRSQGFDRLRPSSDSQPNRSGYLPEYEKIEQKPYSATSWSHQQNTSLPDPYSQSNRSAPFLVREIQPKRDSQLNWWDSRYEPEVFPAFYNKPETKGSEAQPQQPRRPVIDDRTGLPSDYSQSSQRRAQRPTVLIPGVVYEDDARPDPKYYRPAKDGLTRPYYQPNATKTYPQQSPYYRRAQMPISSRKTQTPSRDVYSRPELVDKSFVPYYNPYMTDMRPPVMVVGEYPHVYSIDHSPPHPRDQYKPPSDPYRSQRVGPYDRKRPQSPSRIGYDNVRRRGDKGISTPDHQKPQTTPEKSDSDSKTISEIMESPDLMIGQKFKTFNTLKDIVNGSGLWDALNRPTTFITIFMPTDDAFNSITDGSVEEMKRNPKLVKDFLTQHILGYGLQPQNLKNNMRVKSLNGEMHLINVIDGKIMIDGIDVIAATTAKNGNVYVLDKVLDRSGRRSRSIADELKKRPDLSTFSALFQRSDVNKMLSEESGPFTLLVPNNEALNKMNLRELIKSQKDLNDFMKKHLIEGAVYSNQLSNDSILSDPNRDIRRIGLTSSKTQT